MVSHGRSGNVAPQLGGAAVCSGYIGPDNSLAWPVAVLGLSLLNPTIFAHLRKSPDEKQTLTALFDDLIGERKQLLR
jgi:hypothetical protein